MLARRNAQMFTLDLHHEGLGYLLRLKYCARLPPDVDPGQGSAAVTIRELTIDDPRDLVPHVNSAVMASKYKEIGFRYRQDNTS